MSATNKNLTKKVIISLLVGGTAATAAGIGMYTMNPTRLMDSYIQSKSYDKLVNTYNKKIADSEYEQYYNDKINHIISDIMKEWENNNIPHNDIIEELSYFTNIHNKSIMNISKDHIEYVSVEGDGDILLKEAKDYYHNKDYIKALDSLLKIDESYSQYNNVTDTYNQCINDIMVMTYNSSTDEEYQSSITLLSDCYNLTSNEDFLIQKGNIEKNYTIFKEVNLIINNVELLYKDGSYKEVFDNLNNSLIQYPNNALLINALDHYHNLYVNDITQLINTCIENKEYKEALDILNSANNNHSCTEFTQLIKDVEKKMNPFYSIGEFFNSLFK